MNKSKKYLLVGAFIFLVILILLAIDFSKRTVPPWEQNKIEKKDE